MFKTILRLALSIGVLVLLQMNESYGFCMDDCQKQFDASYETCFNAKVPNDCLKQIRDKLTGCQKNCQNGTMTPNLAPDPYLKSW